MIKFEDDNIEKIYLGDSTIKKIYLGGDLIYTQPVYRNADWIKLGSSLITTFYPTRETEIQADVNIVSKVMYMYQSEASGSSSRNFAAFVPETYTAGSTGYWRLDGKWISVNTVIYLNQWINIKQNKTGGWINGSSVGTYSSPSSFTSNTPLQINTNIKIRTFKVLNNMVLIYDFIPVQEIATGYYGLLDKVSGNFYGNSNNTGQV